ncbi:hypothetical protein CC80DRAFT_494523 [Byssothecium circinans]|uniref:Uncharacterized protein n=1 Tax=Byssothecium circinans TaxID=147558 RepID=A0A6A5TNV0_9PLEO|nr:hypothetical protein CC80DRAFT_494523 [Byssothecium circinans]
MADEMKRIHMHEPLYRGRATTTTTTRPSRYRYVLSSHPSPASPQNPQVSPALPATSNTRA